MFGKGAPGGSPPPKARGMPPPKARNTPVGSGSLPKVGAPPPKARGPPGKLPPKTTSPKTTSKKIGGAPPTKLGGAPPPTKRGGAPPPTKRGGAPPPTKRGGAPPPTKRGGAPPPTKKGGAPPPTKKGGAPPPTKKGGAPPPTKKGGAPPPTKKGGAPPPTKKGGAPPPTKRGGPPPTGIAGGPSAPSQKRGGAPPSTKAPPKSKKEEEKLNSPGPTRYRGITQNDDSDDDLLSSKMAPSKLRPNVETSGGIAGLGPTDSDDDAAFEGYLMKRIGMGGPSTHYWEIRFFRLEKTSKNENILIWWTSHFQDTRKGKLIIKPGVTTCMSYERDAYDEGRRRNLFGIQEKVKGSPVVLDAPNGPMRKKWLECFTSLGATNNGIIAAEQINGQSLKEGWIVKQGQGIGTWHRRFMVLLPQMAMYYKWKRDKRPLGVIPLTKNGKVAVVPSSKGKKFKNCLSLIPNTTGNDEGRREYYMRCYDSDSLKTWVNAFSKAMSGIR